MNRNILLTILCSVFIFSYFSVEAGKIKSVEYVEINGTRLEKTLCEKYLCELEALVKSNNAAASSLLQKVMNVDFVVPEKEASVLIRKKLIQRNHSIANETLEALIVFVLFEQGAGVVFVEPYITGVA